jgi:hypothetical protein
MTSLRIILLCLLLAGCEKTVDNPEWPDYVEKGVLQAELTMRDDSTFIYANLGRTTPLNQPFDFLSSRINDARVSVRRGAETYTLPSVSWSPQNSEFYNYGIALPTTDAREYSISADWNGKHLEGSLTVQKVTTRFDSIVCQTSPTNPKHAFVAFYLRVMPDFRYDVSVFGPHMWTTIYFNTSELPPEGRIAVEYNYLEKGSWSYYIRAENRLFRDWWSNSSGDPFDPAGANPKHNITGDGIGFFTYTIQGNVTQFEVK